MPVGRKAPPSRQSVKTTLRRPWESDSTAPSSVTLSVSTTACAADDRRGLLPNQCR